jgi:hypothetical protein
VVRLPISPSADRQTTVTITNEDGQSVYLPGRIVRSRPQPDGAGQDYQVVVEFFELSAATKALLQHIVARNAERTTCRRPAA